jgi:hypothetical protein
VASDQETAEEALRAAGYEQHKGAAFAGRDVWIKDNGTECVKLFVVDLEGGWFQNDTKGPLSELPTFLQNISLEQVETAVREFLQPLATRDKFLTLAQVDDWTSNIMARLQQDAGRKPHAQA